MAVVEVMFVWAAPVTAGERVRMVAIAPAWLVCAVGWRVTSGVLLGWSSVRAKPVGAARR